MARKPERNHEAYNIQMFLGYRQGRNDDTSMDYACNVALL